MLLLYAWREARARPDIYNPRRQGRDKAELFLSTDDTDRQSALPSIVGGMDKTSPSLSKSKATGSLIHSVARLSRSTYSVHSRLRGWASWIY